MLRLLKALSCPQVERVEVIKSTELSTSKSVLRLLKALSCPQVERVEVIKGTELSTSRACY